MYQRFEIAVQPSVILKKSILGIPTTLSPFAMGVLLFPAPGPLLNPMIAGARNELQFRIRCSQRP